MIVVWFGFACALVGLVLGLALGKKHPLAAAETEADLGAAWDECVKLYSDARKRLGLK